MDERQTFWMLYADGHSTPTHRHGTIEQARAEAERLAEKLNCRVYILQAVEEVELNKFTHTALYDYSNSPF